MKRMQLFLLVSCLIVHAAFFGSTPSEENSLEDILGNLRKEYPGSPEVVLPKEELIIHARSMKQALLELLGGLDTDLEYWRQQRKHVVRYAVNKGPRGWLAVLWNDDDVKKEIANNIGTLERKQQELFKKIGKITTGLQQQSTTNREFLLRRHFYWIREYKKNTAKSVAHLQKPSHLKRHWPEYTVAGVGALVVGGYTYKHWNTLREFVNSAKQGLKTQFDTHAAKPLGQLWNQLLGKNSDGEADIAALRQRLDGGITHFTNLQVEQIQKITVTIDATNALDNDVKQIIKESLTNRNFETADTLITNLETRMQKALIEQYSCFGVIRNNAQLNKLIRETVRATLLSKLNMPYLLGASMLKDTINVALKNVEFVKDSMHTNLILSAMIPSLLVAGGAGYGLKKALTLFKRRAKDFQPLRDTLSDMVTILVLRLNQASVDQRDKDVDEGKLVYLCTKLSAQVKSLADRGLLTEGLIAKVHALEDPTLTTKQRLSLIDNMYKTYWFLSCQPKTA